MATTDPPGRRETINRMAGPAYGRQVITAKGVTITIPVYDLEPGRCLRPMASVSPQFAFSLSISSFVTHFATHGNHT